MEVFVQPIAIEPADIDELGHVNNTVYLRWAQEIAIAHWRARADASMQSAYFWVVRRHEVDYRAPLVLGDMAEARTWVDPQPRGATWGRRVDICKIGVAKPCASINSSWAIMDGTTRRVTRVPLGIAGRFSG
jgi:acyl-CoA thioester hydrolase